jgi:TRAP-type C4-dicarboxylate transport system substrate-binding protein
VHVRDSKGRAGAALALLVGVLGMLSPVEVCTLSFSSATPPTRSAENDALNWWTAEVKRRTNGSLTIKAYHMQALAKLKDADEAVSTDVADIAYVIPAH